MTEKAPKPLPDLARILWAARIDACANRWHLNNRTIPDLKTLAATSKDRRLHEAVKHVEAAIGLTDALLDELRTALDYMQTQPVEAPQDQQRETA
ncbi:hypothetical protein [Labedaea rhizosphaerae]|uniref:Uncharacterized protein n=1 Tax=Labedaea rhizosphaerae TaxID=598644 RepID=A0A4R6SAR6_LABRH|nr:hypothetical protein [Labedaea rhizosphaerae]TDP96623.1 hypothetical protein EV186_104611 [Labedaea rhizosphaerae]